MRIAFVQLDDQRDSIKWSLSKLGSFTIQLMYEHLVNQLAFASKQINIEVENTP